MEGVELYNQSLRELGNALKAVAEGNGQLATRMPDLVANWNSFAKDYNWFLHRNNFSEENHPRLKLLDFDDSHDCHLTKYGEDGCDHPSHKEREIQSTFEE